MKAEHACSPKLITSLLVLILLVVTLFFWNQANLAVEARTATPSDGNFHLPPGETAELPQDLTGYPYPPPETVVEPTPIGEIIIPEDGLFIVTSNGMVEKWPHNPQLYQGVIIGEDGSMIAPGFPGTGLVEEGP